MMYLKVNMKCNFYGIKKIHKNLQTFTFVYFVNVQLLVGNILFFMGSKFLNRSVKSIILEKKNAFLVYGNNGQENDASLFLFIFVKIVTWKGKMSPKYNNKFHWFLLSLPFIYWQVSSMETIVQFFISLFFSIFFFFTIFFFAQK